MMQIVARAVAIYNKSEFRNVILNKLLGRLKPIQNSFGMKKKLNLLSKLGRL
jgi:hypothetical protein